MDDIGDIMKDMTKEVKREIEDSVGNYSYRHSTSSSTITQGGKKIHIVTIDGKTTITINGKEYVEKK